MLNGPVTDACRRKRGSVEASSVQATSPGVQASGATASSSSHGTSTPAGPASDRTMSPSFSTVARSDQGTRNIVAATRVNRSQEGSGKTRGAADWADGAASSGPVGVGAIILMTLLPFTDLYRLAW